jgi:hypothetical protein
MEFSLAPPHGAELRQLGQVSPALEKWKYYRLISLSESGKVLLAAKKRLDSNNIERCEWKLSGKTGCILALHNARHELILAR